MSEGRWNPERTGSLVLAVLVGALALTLGLRLPNAYAWIIGVGAIALAVVLLSWLLGLGRMVRVAGGIAVLVAGIGWPLVSAQRNETLASDNWRWTSAEASGPQVNVSGDRVYAHSVNGTTVLDRATGEELWTFQERGFGELEAIWMRVSDNGSVLFMYPDDSMVYISPVGRELWRIDATLRGTSLVPYAIAEEAVAIGECVPPVPGEEGGPCHFFGMSPDGKVAWEREGYPLPWGEMEGVLSDFRKGMRFADNVSPYLLLRESPEAGAETLVVDAATGDELERLPPADLVFPVGDLLFVSEQSSDDAMCAVRAIRPGERVWEIPEMPCLDDPYVAGSRLYGAVQDGSSVVTVSLEDGAWRDVGDVDLTNDRIAEWRPTYGPLAVPMEQTIAYVDSDQIRVVDAGSGDELWRAVPPTGRSSHPWSISVGNDTVAVAYRTDPGLNPFLTADLRDRGLMITGYDGLTGDVLGQMPSMIASMQWRETPGRDIVPLTWMISAESAIAPAAPGEIYLMRSDDTIVRFGRP